MAFKKPIYFAEPLIKVTSNLREKDSLSQSVNRMADRYLWLLDGRALELSKEEVAWLGEVVLKGEPADRTIIENLHEEVLNSMTEDNPMVERLATKIEQQDMLGRIATLRSIGL